MGTGQETLGTIHSLCDKFVRLSQLFEGSLFCSQNKCLAWVYPCQSKPPTEGDCSQWAAAHNREFLQIGNVDAGVNLWVLLHHKIFNSKAKNDLKFFSLSFRSSLVLHAASDFGKISVKFWSERQTKHTSLVSEQYWYHRVRLYIYIHANVYFSNLRKIANVGSAHRVASFCAGVNRPSETMVHHLCDNAKLCVLCVVPIMTVVSAIATTCSQNSRCIRSRAPPCSVVVLWSWLCSGHVTPVSVDKHVTGNTSLHDGMSHKLCSGARFTSWYWTLKCY